MGDYNGAVGLILYKRWFVCHGATALLLGQGLLFIEGSR